jgi:hypothetical protein
LTAQTIESFVGEAMDEARMGPLHWRLLALVAAGYFFDVLDFTIFGALVPDLIRSGLVTQQQVPWIGSITLLGLFSGTLGQGEFTDRYERKAVYQFNLLLFGLATILAALPPIPSIGFEPGFTWLLTFRFLSGVDSRPSRGSSPRGRRHRLLRRDIDRSRAARWRTADLPPRDARSSRRQRAVGCYCLLRPRRR